MATNSDAAPAAAEVQAGGEPAMPAAEEPKPESAVHVENVDFFYGGRVQALYKVSLHLPRGCRCLLLGDNGAGKTTLLKLLGGRTSTLYGDIRVLDEPADFSPKLNLRRAYLGGDWGKRIVPFAGVTALTADIAVHEMMTKLQQEFPERRKMLFELLQIDENWRMHQVSDGQRRRVQIMLNLLRPVDILFADEITTDLDVVTRRDLMAFLKRETEERGMSIVYTTHIFDGLDGWATHVAYLAAGRLVEFGPIDKWPELVCSVKEQRATTLMLKVMEWISRDRKRNFDKYQECFQLASRDAILPDGSAGGYAHGRLGGADLTLKDPKQTPTPSEGTP